MVRVEGKLANGSGVCRAEKRKQEVAEEYVVGRVASFPHPIN